MAQVQFLKSIDGSAGWKEMEATDDLTLNSFTGNGSRITDLDMDNVSSGILNKAFYDQDMAGLGINFANGVLSSHIKTSQGLDVDTNGMFIDYDNTTIGITSGKLAIIESYSKLSFKTINFESEDDIIAGSSADTLNFVAGTGISFSTDASTNTVTFNTTGGSGGSYIAGDGLVEDPTGTFRLDYSHFNAWKNTLEISNFTGVKLQVVADSGDSPTDEMIIVYDNAYNINFSVNTQGDINCTSISSSGNTTLGQTSSNTISMLGALNSNIIPNASDVRNLGDASHRWEDIFVDDIIDSTGHTTPTTQLQNIPNSGTSRPAASASVRGLIYTTEGASGVADITEICLKSSSNSYSWVQIVTG